MTRLARKISSSPSVRHRRKAHSPKNPVRKKSGSRRPKELEHLKSDFVSTVSHELRTPLTALREALSLVLDGVMGKTDEEARKFLSIARNNADRLKALIDDLLDISRLEVHRMRLDRIACDLPALLADLPDSFQLAVRKKQVCFQTEFEPDLPPVLADRDRILQVLVNLVGNAIKYVGMNGQVKVRMSLSALGRAQGSFVLTEVTDDGMGIPEKELPKIFDKFHQVGRVFGPGMKGTGLGLSISRRIVELHKGRIWVKSQLGKGTIFSFMLPVYSDNLACREIFEEHLERAAYADEMLGCIVFELENFAAIAGHRSLREAHYTVEMLHELAGQVGRSDIRILKCHEVQLICLLPHSTQNEAKDFLDRATAHMKGKIFPWPVRIGVGMAIYPRDGRTWSGLIRTCENKTETVLGEDVSTQSMGPSPKRE